MAHFVPNRPHEARLQRPHQVVQHALLKTEPPPASLLWEYSAVRREPLSSTKGSRHDWLTIGIGWRVRQILHDRWQWMASSRSCSSSDSVASERNLLTNPVDGTTLRTLGIACCAWLSVKSLSRSFRMVSAQYALDAYADLPIPEKSLTHWNNDGLNSCDDVPHHVRPDQRLFVRRNVGTPGAFPGVSRLGLGSRPHRLRNPRPHTVAEWSSARKQLGCSRGHHVAHGKWLDGGDLSDRCVTPSAINLPNSVTRIRSPCLKACWHSA